MISKFLSLTICAAAIGTFAQSTWAEDSGNSGTSSNAGAVNENHRDDRSSTPAPSREPNTERCEEVVDSTPGNAGSVNYNHREETPARHGRCCH